MLSTSHLHMSSIGPHWSQQLNEISSKKGSEPAKVTPGGDPGGAY